MLHQLKDSEYHLKPALIRMVIATAGNFRDSCIVKVFAQTGIRRAELAALDIQDVNFDERLMHIRHGKGDKARIVPLTDELTADLRRLIGNRKIGVVFHSQHGNRLTFRQVNWIVAMAGQKAGVVNPNPKYRNLTCHLFRHSFAREWKRLGGSIETLSKILGHSSVKTTLDVYGTEGLTDVQENYALVMAKIWGKQRITKPKPPLGTAI